MEFISEEYKRCIGNVVTTTDGYKYVQSKVTEKYIYLKCAIFRDGCKGTGKINLIRNLIAPMKEHNHSVDDYKSDIFKLKTKCKTMAKQVETTGLREVFDDVTRNDICARGISFAECGSSMYRARRKTQPKVPLTPSEFVDMLSTTSFGVHFKFSVRIGEQTGVVFFSNEMRVYFQRSRIYSLMQLFKRFQFNFINYGRYLLLLMDIHFLLSTLCCRPRHKDYTKQFLKISLFTYLN